MNDFYQQPDFYRFNEDSIKLVAFAVLAEKDLKAESICDLGAGSGVVGLEAILKMKCIKHTLFVEYQKEFLPFLNSNIERSKQIRNFDSEIINASFSELQINQTFDVLLSNPPYFLIEKGRLPENENRLVARFWAKDSWADFFKSAANLMNDGSRFYLVVPKNEYIEAEKHLKLFKILQKISEQDLFFIQLMLNK